MERKKNREFNQFFPAFPLFEVSFF